MERADEFFVPVDDEYSTIATPAGVSFQWMSDKARLELSVLGAVVALCLIYGLGVEPLNPLLLIYLINDCEIGSLKSSLVREWFPGLHHTLTDWISTGPDEDISRFSGHFASYHDTQVCNSQNCKSFPQLTILCACRSQL